MSLPRRKIAAFLFLLVLGVVVALSASRTIEFAGSYIARVIAQEKLRQSRSAMFSVCAALKNYHTTFDCLPPAVVRSREGRPLYSWRVLILHFLGRDDVLKRFRLDEPWDSPHNLPVSLIAPPEFRSARFSGS